MLGRPAAVLKSVCPSHSTLKSYAAGNPPLYGCHWSGDPELLGVCVAANEVNTANAMCVHVAVLLST